MLCVCVNIDVIRLLDVISKTNIFYWLPLATSLTVSVCFNASGRLFAGHVFPLLRLAVRQTQAPKSKKSCRYADVFKREESESVSPSCARFFAVYVLRVLS